MAGSGLLDTSVLVDLFRGDSSIADQADELDELFSSVVVIGELLYGARHSGNAETNLALIAEFSSQMTVLPVDGLTAETYSRLKHELRAKGRPIPDNDLWIAATAVQHGLPLVARDAHFGAIDQVQYVAW